MKLDNKIINLGESDIQNFHTQVGITKDILCDALNKNKTPKPIGMFALTYLLSLMVVNDGFTKQAILQALDQYIVGIQKNFKELS